MSDISLLTRAEEISKSYHQVQMYDYKDYFSSHIEDDLGETAGLLNKYFTTVNDSINISEEILSPLLLKGNASKHLLCFCIGLAHLVGIEPTPLALCMASLYPIKL